MDFADRRGLAVFAPVLGTLSETFVARHVEGLAPGRTVVVTVRDERSASAPPAPEAPTLALTPLLEYGDWIDQPYVIDATLRFLEDRGVGVVLLEFLDVWIDFVRALCSAGLRVVAHAHGYDVSSRLRDPYWVDAYDIYRGVPVVVPSEAARRRLLESVPGLSRDDAVVIPYGVDVGAAPVRPPRQEVRCLAVGRMVAKKAPLSLVRAFAAAAAVEPALQLTIIGDGPLFGEVEALISALDAEHHVRLLGARPHDDVTTAMARTDVFVQHSVTDPETGDEEGLPVAILEAMAAGLPVVATRHAGIPEAVVDGATGLLVDEGDVDGMADALVALARDAERRSRLGAAGHQSAATRFSWPRERADLRQLLQL